jgi:hypothetical protein
MMRGYTLGGARDEAGICQEVDVETLDCAI